MKRRAFTLIEVLTTVAIIGTLATLTSYAYQSSSIRSRDYKRLTDLQTVQNSLEQFYLDNRVYPKTSDTAKIFAAKWQLENVGGPGCSYETGKKFLSPVYITEIPQDPRHELVVNTPCTTNHFGQYLYIATGDAKAPRDYYLMARVERKQNMSQTIPSAADLAPYANDFLSGNSNGIKLCDQGGFDSSCTHNYFLSSKN